MISHREFAQLRLFNFCPSNPGYRDEKDEHGDLQVESLRGIEFYQHARVKSGTLFICIDLLDNLTDAGPIILSHIGLPLTCKSSLPDVTALLGGPVMSKVDPDLGYDYFRADYHQFNVPDPSGYKVTCTWLHPGKVGRYPALRVEELSLWAVRIERTDLASFPWSD